MIDENKINEAAGTHTTFFGGIKEEERYACRESFITGAKWALQEFKKSLWHDAKKELPKEDIPCLVRGVFYTGDTVYHDIFISKYQREMIWGRIEYDWDIEKQPRYIYDDVLERVTHWCYLSDILPKDILEKYEY